MIRRIFTKKNVLASLLSGFLVLSFLIVPVSQTLEVKRVEAQWAVVDLPHTVQGTISAIANVASEVSEFYVKQKEMWLDGIAWQLTNIMLKEVIKSTTKWVNSGFSGNPTFVTDFNQFITGVADKAAGNFIWGNKELKFLCSPFKLDIQLALDLQYRETRGDYRSECTLSSVVGNMNNFFKGDFLAGGWNGWHTMTQNPKNNPYGAMLEAQGALTMKISGEKSKEIKLLDFGKGFFSMKDPRCKPDPANPDDFEESRCQLVTPGTAIESQLNTSLAGGLQRLQVADEINELLGALFAQLAGTIFSSAGGLLGSTDSGSGSGGGSIFDDIRDEPDPSTTGPSPFEEPLRKEKSYRDLVQEIVDLIESARIYREESYPNLDPNDEDNDRCLAAGNLTSSLESILTEYRIELRNSTSTIADLEMLEADLMVLNDAASPISTIQALLNKYDASSTPAAKTKITGRFMSLQSSGVLHDTGEIGRLQAETLPRIREEVRAFIASVDQACASVRVSLGGNPSSIRPVPEPWNVIMSRQFAASGEIKAYRIPRPTGVVSVAFTQGQGTQTPPQPVTEYYVSRTPGEIRVNQPGYYRSQSILNNGMRIYLEQPQTPPADISGIAYAPTPDPWYINVRWTYPTCPFSNCGFNLQWTL